VNEGREMKSKLMLTPLVEDKRMKKNILISTLLIGFFAVWLGIPTFNKWRADRMVDELCAKDGGIKVYETVTLPKERFNQWGKFEVRDGKHMKPGDEYYSVWKVTNIEGRHESSDISSMTVYQSHFLIYRISDKKLLGESISYTRRGGDPISPSHPSSYSCNRVISMESQIFKSSPN
jgi:hypothetical protein